MYLSFERQKPKLGQIWLIALAIYILSGLSQTQAQIFVTSTTGSIAEYSTSGQAMNTSLVTGLNHPDGIAVSGTDLFVGSVIDGGTSSVSEYTTSGQTLNAPLITISNTYVLQIAISGDNLFVMYATGTEGDLGVYTTSGETVTSPLISSGFYANALAASGTDIYLSNGDNSSNKPTILEYTSSGQLVTKSLIVGVSANALAISGTDLFALTTGSNGEIGEYTTSGQTVNASLITGLVDPEDIAISGTDIFVTSGTGTNGGIVGEYTTSGETVNATLITGLNSPYGIAVVPEPSTMAIAGMDLVMLGWIGRRRLSKK